MKQPQKSYIVGECKEDEACLAIVPSARLGAAAFLSVLQKNGIESRALGTGTGRVQDASGGSWRVPGVVIVAVAKRHERRVQAHARMCSVAIARIERI